MGEVYDLGNEMEMLEYGWIRREDEDGKGKGRMVARWSGDQMWAAGRGFLSIRGW